jgi:histidyl-tRNA synthetase
MATACNIEQDKLNSVFIALDKLDKIGIDGVKEELAKLEINNTSIEQYCSYFANTQDATTCKQFFEQFAEAEDKDASKNIDDIIYCVKDVISKNGKIVFDPTLVRGMSYYTGTIFEISLEEMNMSIAGGGRYDKMIGEFCGLDVPACGFSIGFERILWLLKQNNFRENSDKQKIAYLISKDVSVEKTKQTMQVVAQKRASGEQVLISPRNKNVKLQKERLFELGYTKFIDVFEDTEI